MRPVFGLSGAMRTDCADAAAVMAGLGRSDSMGSTYDDVLQAALRDPAVAADALFKLPDLCVLAQERMPQLLNVVFRMGLYSGADVGQALAETVSLLNVQAGY